MAVHRVEMKPASTYRSREYGVLLESVTRHDMTGPGVHNRHHPHSIQVWENRVRDGVLTDPHGKPTSERYSVLTSAHAVVITAHREERPPQGPMLQVGDTVILHVNGFEIGQYEVTAKALHDPVLVKVEEVTV